ncbi:ATP-binding cassette sub-family G member 2 [Auxenochlorella protothecoides]|uniref:ATP-binding cassette sub-family G member 2 n=1 Tax=Auxenochlorella protothecoides TaxID=3075 RepID=A0A087SPI7_AUXPR|nr:ATP-binding cassette sub-family G member 2 [Auxenochlorella protothecoides]KFM27641.1 ATP-binding cassette sub-family G member 2 [Auxenochlorella protothecoides]
MPMLMYLSIGAVTASVWPPSGRNWLTRLLQTPASEDGSCYSGGRTLEAFSTLLTEKVQSDAHARVELLDTFASKFLGSADQAGLLAQTEEAVLTLTGEAQANGALYVRYMKKAVEKGAAWVDTELARLEKLASGASASGAKVQERSVWGRLDMLANNVYGGTQTGSVYVNGAPRQRAAFQRQSCYVLQRDVLLSSSTVREAITLSALLKLPQTMTREEKQARVDETLAELELEGCQNTLIGDDLIGIKGISGGQKRRVSVGIELVKEPGILFLDEPTSGLDSEMAVSLMTLLVRLARKGKTVVVTIHQPNSLITSKFDDFMLLADGRTVFSGAWSDALPFFGAAGYPCPAYTNPSDHFLSVLKEEGARDKLVAQHEALAAKDLETGDGNLTALPEALAVEGRSRSMLEQEEAAQESRPDAPFVRQVALLSQRMARMWVRNPVMLMSELAQYGFLAVFMGLMYLRLNHSTTTGLSDRLASLWFGLAILSFTPSYTAVTIWDKDRLLLRRESQQGMYSIPAWFLARTLTVTPMQIAQTTLFCCISYWMIGYIGRPGSFFVYVLVYNLFQLVSETIGMLCAMLTKNSTYAILVLTFVLLILLSFSGFLVSSIPVYFKWVGKMSYLTYAYTALVQNETQYLTLYTPEGAPVAASTLVPSQIQNGLSIAVNCVILACIYLGSRLLALLGLVVMSRFRFL